MKIHSKKDRKFIQKSWSLQISNASDQGIININSHKKFIQAKMGKTIELKILSGRK
jgi:hypothetical protein